MVRPAKPGDKKELMKFIREIWGGHDYIPHVWDEWLRDPQGRVFVVDVGGVPVGMNRVRFMKDGSAWFEGARVHPDFRGQGLASMLGENSMRVAKRRGANVFRLASGSRNKTAHRQIARMGFKEKSRISVYKAPAGRRFRESEVVRRATRRDLRDVVRMIRSSREYRLGSGVYWDAFSAAALTPATIERLVDEGSVWLGGDSVGVVRVGGEGKDLWHQVCFLGGGPGNAKELVGHILAQKMKPRPARRFVYLPQRSPLIGALRREGFENWGSLILFESRAPKG
ncbi:MAG: GNAT family N-acetyltransferase [Thaumarchaeota archaeon]|nr:GNAT family N-acetyltransferase [Nitrososphaerota archaeon]